MSEPIFSILLVLIGLFVGVIVMFIVNYIKGASAGNKAEKIIENAKAESEKIKRNSILESKEEAYKIKLEAEKTLKESKEEAKAIEDRLLARENNIDRIYYYRELSLQNIRTFYQITTISRFFSLFFYIFSNF